MTAETVSLKREEPRTFFLNDPKVRSVVIQVLVIAALFAAGWWIFDNTTRNLRSSNIASGYGFLGSRAGFDIAQLPIAYTSNATYGRALLVGVLNTIIVASCGIALATIVGFIVGVGRLSHNYIVRTLSTIYVEIFRNLPPLLVILFWYFGVLTVLPLPRDAVALPFSSFISNRGLQTPIAIFEQGAWVSGAFILVGIVCALVLARVNRRHQMATGERRPTLLPAIALVIGLPLVVFFLTGTPASMEFPEQGRFNLTGGFNIRPEFLALLLALSFYTASFIAEIVRAGILSVSHGQNEAAAALGLRRNLALRLVVVPQAFRVIIPPLTSQYLNLTKNSSLGLAIGYPEVVAIGNTVLNQTGQSVEVVAFWMMVYLGLSLTVAVIMNWFNARMRLVER